MNYGAPQYSTPVGNPATTPFPATDLHQLHGVGYAGRLTIEDLRARYARLDQLSRGLAREAQLFAVGSKVNDPLLYLERNAYRGAIQDALAGVEKARVTLAKALHRLESAGC